MKLPLVVLCSVTMLMLVAGCNSQRNSGEHASNSAMTESDRLKQSVISARHSPPQEPTDETKIKLFTILSDDVFVNFPAYSDSVESSSNEFERHERLGRVGQYRTIVNKLREDTKAMVLRGSFGGCASSEYSFGGPSGQQGGYYVFTEFSQRKRLRNSKGVIPTIDRWLQEPKARTIWFRDPTGVHTKSWNLDYYSSIIGLAMTELPQAGIIDSNRNASVFMPMSSEQAKTLDLLKRSREQNDITFVYYWRPIDIMVKRVMSDGASDFYVMGELLAYQLFVGDDALTDLVGCGPLGTVKF